MGCPGLWVRAAGEKASERGVRHLGRLAVTRLGAPAKPLFEVSYILEVCYHLGILEPGGERFSCSPPRYFLEGDLLELLLYVVGFFSLRHFFDLRLLGAVRSYGAVLGAVALAGLLGDYHRLEALADEVVGVQLLVG